MKLTLLYFAAVADLLGRREEMVDAPAKTVGELATWLEAQHEPLRGRLGSVRFARNEAFAGHADALAEGDVVALIPPVAGG